MAYRELTQEEQLNHTTAMAEKERHGQRAAAPQPEPETFSGLVLGDLPESPRVSRAGIEGVKYIIHLRRAPVTNCI